MDAAFASIAFIEPARAEANLALLERRLPANLWATLPALLAQLPDPDGALNFLERYLRPESDGARGSMTLAPTISFLRRHPAALHHLLAIFSYSRFLSETLIQQPDLITWLHRPARRASDKAPGLERMKSPEDLHEEFARFEAVSPELPPAVLLARFKRREYLRITLRDVLGLATLAETTLELSHLADVLLERALRISEQNLQNAYGTPQFIAAGNRSVARLTVFSLGKLGGQELNYSSDIDLMFLCGGDGETSGGVAGVTTNAEYFIRLAQAVLKLITEFSPEGPLFRVDLRLRPQGQEGDLATSLAAALDYYRTRAREWELQMLIKARCSAGDTEVGRRFLREMQPLIYRHEFNLAAVEAVLNARQEIARDLRRRTAQGTGHAARWNVKLSPGGIRDIEFLTQCLQRLYGGGDPWLRSHSTLVALQRLHDKGHLSGRDFFRLGSAYQFLRKVEHRLQLRDGLQRHTLPEAPDALERLAYRCGVEASAPDGRTAAERLLQQLTQHFSDVREIYDRILARQTSPPAAALEHEPGADTLLRRLRLEHADVAQAVARIPSSDTYARRGLLHFLGSAVLDPALMAELAAHPEWIGRTGEIFSLSDFAAEMLARHPQEIRVLADPGLAGFRGPLLEPGKLPPEQAMAAVRIAYRRGVLAIIVRALLGTTQPFETFEILTRLADEALGRTLELAARETPETTDLEDGPFTILALGRLGTSEMDIGSDADLVFLTEEQLSSERREPWRRLAERVIHLAGSHTREGLLFPVDTRLRPRGTEGEMVQSVAYVRDYFHSEAEGWEAATFLKARPVAGNLALGTRAIRQVRAILCERLGKPAELARQLAHTRERLEKESAESSRKLATKGEFKKLPGGYYDVEYILAYLLLTGDLREDTGTGRHVLRQVARLESVGAVTTTQAQSLRQAALFYRSLDHAVRLLTGRPAHRLPETALAERATRLLKLWQIPLLEDLEAAVTSMRHATRALFEQIVLSARPT